MQQMVLTYKIPLGIYEYMLKRTLTSECVAGVLYLGMCTVHTVQTSFPRMHQCLRTWPSRLHYPDYCSLYSIILKPYDIIRYILYNIIHIIMVILFYYLSVCFLIYMSCVLPDSLCWSPDLRLFMTS